jgi:hypothetical protein
MQFLGFGERIQRVIFAGNPAKSGPHGQPDFGEL